MTVLDADDVGPWTHAALRDASMLERPNTRFVKVFHVDRGNGTAACASTTGRSSRCNSQLAEFTRRSLDAVPASLRCRRPGCRVRWPK